MLLITPKSTYSLTDGGGDGQSEIDDRDEKMSESLKRRKNAEASLKDLHAKNHFFLSPQARDVLDRFHQGVEFGAWMSGDEMAELDLESLNSLRKEIEVEAERTVRPRESNTWTIVTGIGSWIDSLLKTPAARIRRYSIRR